MVYAPNDVPVPCFLPDLPAVRREVAQYFVSVHRCDETVGQILQALKESGLEDNTLVMFLSDNGMAFPFAKTNCYLNSTHTPWIVRWPGKVKPGVDREHFISGIDFMPTVLEAAGIAPVDGMDGRSFVPVLSGEKQAGRESVYTVFNETVAKRPFAMRSIQNRHFGYIFNAWSDGKTRFQSESSGSASYKGMVAAAKDNPRIAARVKLLDYRVPEELYDYEADPCGLHNLIDDAKLKNEREQLQREMLRIMEKSGDPLLNLFKLKIGSAKE